MTEGSASASERRMGMAVVLVSHGTVDDLDDLPAFVTKIRHGRPAPPELVAELRRRYEAIGGKSPLDAINAELARKLAARLGVPVRRANRLWKPYVHDVFAELAAEGRARVAVVPLAQFSAHVYAKDTLEAYGAGASSFPFTLTQCVQNWGGAAALCAAFARRIANALAGADLARTTVVMTAHSLPRAIVDAGDPYERDVRAAAESIAAKVRERIGADVRSTLVFQSQGLSTGPGGRPMEWLGPDIASAVGEAAERGSRLVVFAPVGFLADHVEILYDLDVEARAMVEARGLSFRRAASLDADDDLVDVVASLARPLLQLDETHD
jgi:ferrochelatase